MRCSAENLMDWMDFTWESQSCRLHLRGSDYFELWKYFPSVFVAIFGCCLGVEGARARRVVTAPINGGTSRSGSAAGHGGSEDHPLGAKFTALKIIQIRKRLLPPPLNPWLDQASF